MTETKINHHKKGIEVNMTQRFGTLGTVVALNFVNNNNLEDQLVSDPVVSFCDKLATRYWFIWF